MYVTPFHHFFPKLAADECRSVILMGEIYRGEVPPGEYGFIESYCDDPSCDCRRVMISVLASDGSGILATISFGFDPDDTLKGPFLDPINRQSEYAEELLHLFRDVIIQDEAYVARLERHYQLVKQAVSQHRRLRALERRKERKKEKRRLKRSRAR